MTVYVAYVPIFRSVEGSRPKGLMKRRFQVRDFVSGRGHLLAEFLDATRLGTAESVVLREARRFSREHGAVLLLATGGPLQMETPSAAKLRAAVAGRRASDQAYGGPLSSTVLPSGSSM
ncbi:MAG: hypothetical protein QNI93_08735 [Kiloniellales bacterium]|nr:hypothetical protein [Kiloniellales bacterium]